MNVQSNIVTYRCLLCKEEKECQLYHFHEQLDNRDISVVIPLCSKCGQMKDSHPLTSSDIVIEFVSRLVLDFEEVDDGKQS